MREDNQLIGGADIELDQTLEDTMSQMVKLGVVPGLHRRPMHRFAIQPHMHAFLYND